MTYTSQARGPYRSLIRSAVERLRYDVIVAFGIIVALRSAPVTKETKNTKERSGKSVTSKDIVRACVVQVDGRAERNSKGGPPD